MYPPFGRIGLVEIKSKNQKEAERISRNAFDTLKNFKYGSYLQIFTPSPPLISKAKDFYRYHVVVKSSRKTDPSGKILIESFRHLRQNTDSGSGVRITYDIDAMNFL